MAITGVAFTAYPVTDYVARGRFHIDTLGLTRPASNRISGWRFDVAGSTFGGGNFRTDRLSGQRAVARIRVSDLAALARRT